VCRLKHVEQLRNIGIISSTKRSHLIDSFYEIYIMMHGSMNIKLIKIFGYLDMLSFVRISLLILIGHVNRMISKRTVSEVFGYNPQGSRLRIGIVYKQMLISAKLQIGKTEKQS
jgi:hypothetical protein